MRSRWLPVSAAVLCAAHTACTNGGFASADNPTGTGPFDSQGNYIEAWADNPSQWQGGSSRPVDATPDRPPVEVAVTSPVLASNTSPATTTTTVIHRKPSPPAAQVTAKPKPKPAPVKVKPKSIRHTVRKGDSLYAIAKRYGTSVGAVQRANNIRGTVIHPGQSLVIPR